VGIRGSDKEGGISGNHMFKWGLFSPKALDSLDLSTRRINIWEGAVRSSKTITSLVRWMEFVKTAPQGDFLMAGKTERTLKRNILNPLTEIVGNKHFRYNMGLGEARLFGTRIYIVGANDERAEGKIRGLTIAGAYLDEITLMPESFFDMLLSRLSVDGAMLFGSTNTDSPFHWLKTQFLEREDLDLASFHFELDDNLNLSEKFKENLKKEYTGLWYKRLIEGLWVMAQGAIYDMFDDAFHAIDVPKKLAEYIKIWCAVDYGTSNPCTFGLYGKHQNGNTYKLREYWYDGRESGRQKTDSEYVKDFVKWLREVKPQVVYLDPSAASFKAELRKLNFNVQDANNDILDGIRFISGMLGNGKYFIDKSCENTRKEYVSYVWDSNAQRKGEDKPLKQNDHAVDCDRYGLFTEYSRGEINIRWL